MVSGLGLIQSVVVYLVKDLKTVLNWSCGVLRELRLGFLMTRIIHQNVDNLGTVQSAVTVIRGPPTNLLMPKLIFSYFFIFDAPNRRVY